MVMKELKQTLDGRPALMLLKDRQNLVGVEIGVAWGDNALAMMEELDIKKLYLIDAYKYVKHNEANPYGKAEEQERSAKKKLKPYEDRIVWIHDISSSAVDKIKDNELDFVYIDGCHRYEVVVKDIQLYHQKVKDGGLVSGHDYRMHSVKKAVHDTVKCKINCAIDIPAHSEWWYVKQ